MNDTKWSESEKKLARMVFQEALAAELSIAVAEFKAKAAAVVQADDMWALEEHLSRKRRQIDIKYDFRYSQLLLVFGQLLREGQIQEVQLQGLTEDKQNSIRRLASL